MLCSLCASSPLRWSLVSLEIAAWTSSAAASRHRLFSTTRERSINTTYKLRSLPRGSLNLISPRHLEQTPSNVTSTSDVVTALDDSKSLTRRHRAAISPKIPPKADRFQASSNRRTSPKRFDLRDDAQKRPGDTLDRSRFVKKSMAARAMIQSEPRERELWQIQKNALVDKFGNSGWSPRKRLSPDSLEGIRMLHAQYPDRYTTPVLADHFKVSPEAIRRILKSKWRPNDDEEENRRQRWNKRGVNIWGQMNELGIKPPRKWRDQGVGKLADDTSVTSGQAETLKRAGGKAWSTISRSSEHLPAIPSVKSEVDEIPLADRIF